MRIIPLYLTYDNEKIQDGVGAQLLRIIGIRAICNYFKLGYIHSGIKKLTITQLDPAQSEEEIHSYISYLNGIFKFDSQGIKEFHEVYHIYNLSHRILLTYGLRAFFFRRTTLLKVVIPFYITNKNIKIFKSASDLLPRFNSKMFQDKIKLVIHFRAGADPSHIDTGKTEARFLPINYFEKLVFQIQKDNPGHEWDICLLTDAPAEPFYYSPPMDQLEKWEETGYKIKNGLIEIKALNLSSSNIAEIPGFRIVHGGDPVEALKEMASADYLLMSRSTLSFVGALLNQTGLIFYPPRFGSQPLTGWISGEDYTQKS